MHSFKIEFVPRYHFSLDGTWIVRPCSSKDWKKHEYPKIRVWRVSKHSWRWSAITIIGSAKGRSTTKDQAVQSAIRYFNHREK